MWRNSDTQTDAHMHTGNHTMTANIRTLLAPHVYNQFASVHLAVCVHSHARTSSCIFTKIGKKRKNPKK